MQNLEGENRDAFDTWVPQRVMWRPRVFKVKCQEDTYNDETRLKYTLQSCEELDFAADSMVRSQGGFQGAGCPRPLVPPARAGVRLGGAVVARRG